MSHSVSRRRLLKAAGATAAASATGSFIGSSPAHAAIPPARADIGVSAHPFELGQVRLTASRWLDNQDRTRNYLRFV
ncbi:twin-arginine translocation signal domain-containing protein, partial [Streptomyces chartreusis]|uniref:twin-arginine translocation signal domain-containing protein n=1 Tax=Streptomyces chartreusis TaxID=1969 RepID=UPI0033A7B608